MIYWYGIVNGFGARLQFVIEGICLVGIFDCGCEVAENCNLWFACLALRIRED